MAPEDTSGARPAPVALRIKLRYDTVETLVQRFAPNVGKSGLFLPTKSLQPVGAEVKFELRLADDKVVITGLGRVKNAKAPDSAAPKASFGMGIELMRVTPASRDVILRILAKRKELGLAEVAIPSAADIDAARTAVDTGVRDAAASGVPAGAPLVDSGPVLESGPVPRAAIPTPAATPIVVAPAAERDSNPVLEGPAPKMTSPRRHSASIAVQKLSAVEPLAPEPPRKKRPNVQEIVDRASGPVAVAMTNVPGLDDDVDVNAVLARARALAIGDLDAELDALRESAAAPMAISIEAASAELARSLGGAAVSRDRSAKWAPPPPVADEAPVAEDARSFAAIALHVETPALIDDDVSADVFVARDSAPVLELEPDPETPDPEEVHALAEGDFEEVEHTQIAGESEPVSTIDQELEDRVAQQIEADDEDMGIAEIQAQIAPETHRPAPTLAGYSAPETYTKPAIIQPTYDLPAYDSNVDPLVQPPVPEEDIPEEDDDAEAIGDFEIVAEADVADEDLREHPASDLAEDFAARLEFSDEHERLPDDPNEAALDAALEGDTHDPLAGFQTQDPDSSFPPLRRFDQSDVIRVANPRPASAPRAERVEGYDLENALEALDVDLDDLSVEEEAAPPMVLHKRRTTPSHVPKRAQTDDGVLIDFDDDDE